MFLKVLSLCLVSFVNNIGVCYILLIVVGARVDNILAIKLAVYEIFLKAKKKIQIAQTSNTDQIIRVWEQTKKKIKRIFLENAFSINTLLNELNN